MNMLSTLNLRAMVVADHGQPMTTSYAVAEAFGKKHFNVLRDIEKLGCSDNFRKLNFEVCFENNNLQNGKPRKFYRMSKDGWMFLVMGYTGKLAAQIKESYIDAFNWMANQLSETGKAKWARLNHLMLTHKFKKSNASDNGRGLVQWRYEKGPLEHEIEQLTDSLQMQIGFETR